MANPNPITAANASASTRSSSSSSSVPGLDTAALIEEVQRFTSAARTANAKMVEEVTALALTSEEDHKKMSDANKIVKMQELNAKMKSQQTLRHIADEADTYQILEKLAVKGTEYKLDAMKQEDDVKELTKLREEGNFLQFIGAGLRLPGEKRQVTAANKAVESNTKAIEAVERSTTSTFRTLTALEEVHTEATIQANEDMISAQYQIDKVKRAKDTAILAATQASASLDMTVKQIEAVARLSNAEVAAMNAKTAKASLKNETMNAEAITPAINKTREARGQPRIKVGVVSAILDSGNSEQKAKLLADTETGLDIVIKDPEGAIAIAGSPGAALNLAAELDSPILNVPSSVTKLKGEADFLLQQKYAEENKDASLMSQAQVDSDYNTILAEKNKAARRMINPGGNDIYSSVPLSTLLSKAKRSTAIKEEPLFKKYLAAMPMSDQRAITTPPIDEQLIYNIAVEAVRDGGLTLDEAVRGYNTIFKVSNEYDRRLGQHESFRLDRATNYNVILVVDKGKVHGFMDKKEIVDATDPTRTKAAMIKSLSSSSPELSSAITASIITGSPITGAIKGSAELLGKQIKQLIKDYKEDETPAGGAK